MEEIVFLNIHIVSYITRYAFKKSRMSFYSYENYMNCTRHLHFPTTLYISHTDTDLYCCIRLYSGQNSLYSYKMTKKTFQQSKKCTLRICRDECQPGIWQDCYPRIRPHRVRGVLARGYHPQLEAYPIRYPTIRGLMEANIIPIIHIFCNLKVQRTFLIIRGLQIWRLETVNRPRFQPQRPCITKWTPTLRL